MDINKYIKNILVVYKFRDCSTCAKVTSILDELGMRYEKKMRDDISEKDFWDEKLVLIVGGDGTTLKVCQLINNNSLVLAVNSHPGRTEGFLTRAGPDDFKAKMKKLIDGDFKITSYPRLQAKINRHLLPKTALNEVSISTRSSYHTLIYSLHGNREKATGILVSTPLGSTAWARSAGGKVMPLSSTKMQFVIREPYHGKIHKVQQKHGLVDSFSVKAESEGVVVFDSVIHEYPFKHGDMITVTKSASSINFVEY